MYSITSNTLVQNPNVGILFNDIDTKLSQIDLENSDLDEILHKVDLDSGEMDKIIREMDNPFEFPEEDLF